MTDVTWHEYVTCYVYYRNKIVVRQISFLDFSIIFQKKNVDSMRNMGILSAKFLHMQKDLLCTKFSHGAYKNSRNFFMTVPGD